MADKAVSELVEAERITATDLFVLEQNGTAKKLTGQVLLNWLTAAADGHGGIQSISKVDTNGLVDTYRITLADTTVFDFVVNNGKGISGITKTAASGLVDTYTIQYNDGTSGTFTVTNGAKGDKGDNTYTWIKYASQEPTASSHSFGDVPDNWIGIYFGSADTAPTDWTQYQWFKIKGEKGDTGSPATMISSKVEYQASDSGSIIPSGVWSESVPVVPQGRYLWTRTTQNFNTGSPVVAYSVSRMGLDGSGSVSSVAGVSPDPDGNVPLTAESVGALSSAGGEMTGSLNMNGQSVNGLNAPTTNDQAANMGYVNQQVKKAATRDLLNNSNFRNPVNQRGDDIYTDNGQYTIDRWIYRGGNGSSLAVEDGHITLTMVDTTSYTAVKQPVNTAELELAGKTVTFAVHVLEATTPFRLRITGSTTASGDTTAYRQETFNTPGICLLTTTLPDPLTYSYLSTTVSLEGAGSVHIEWAALYEGEYTAETLPEYQPKGYGAELAECQRYFIQYNMDDAVFPAKIYSTSMKADVALFLPNAMRLTRPTVNVTAEACQLFTDDSFESCSITEVVFSSGNYACLTAVASKALKSNAPAIARILRGTLTLSADL